MPSFYYQLQIFSHGSENSAAVRERFTVDFVNIA